MAGNDFPLPIVAVFQCEAANGAPLVSLDGITCAISYSEGGRVATIYVNEATPDALDRLKASCEEI